VAHLLDVAHVRPDLGEEVGEQLRLPEALEVVLGRCPGDPQDEVLEVLLAARQFVVDALGGRGEVGRGTGVGGEELSRLLFGNPVPDVLDGLNSHTPTQTRTARRNHEVPAGRPLPMPTA
jgi:hypothetical protein